MKVNILIHLKDKAEINRLLDLEYKQNANDHTFNGLYGRFIYQHVDNISGRILFLKKFNKINNSIYNTQ